MSSERAPVTSAAAANLPMALPASRSSWSGLVQFSLVAFPVKAYPSVSTSESSHFHQLHADCGQRIRYEKRCPVHGPIDPAVIVKGYPYGRDRYVVVDAAELDQLRPVQDRALRLEKFTEPNQIDPIMFAGRSLHLLPDGLAAQRPYRLLTAVLKHKGRWALGRVVLSSHRYLVVVRPTGSLLTLDVLHYPERLRRPPGGPEPIPSDPAFMPEELQLAGQLIDQASGPVDWGSYRDANAAELAALVETKVTGQQGIMTTPEPVSSGPLLETLKQSVAALSPDIPTVDKPRKPSRRRTA